MKPEPVVLIIVCAISTALVQSANILVLLPFPAYSHFNCFLPLLHELKNRNHNLTVVSPFQINDERITEISLAGIQKFFPPVMDLKSMDRFRMMFKIHEIADSLIQGSFTLPNFHKLVHDNETHYDLIMMEFYYSEAYLAFARKFNAPIVALIPQTMQISINWRLSNPVDFSTISNIYLPYTNRMSFIQRVINTFFGVMQILVYDWKYMPGHQEIIDNEFTWLSGQNKDVYSMAKDIALTLVNSHYSFSDPKPYLPNIIEVGGIHLMKPKPLPQDLKKFMDEAPDGVVFISFGSLVDTTIVHDWGRVIMQVFGNSTLRVLWKWKTSLLPQTVPANFLVQDWFPQNDILNHPNCRILFSHGGIHSIIEGVNANVPILALPFFSDQSHNVAAMEQAGMGISISDMQEDKLKSALDKILHNPSYKQKMNYRSKLFRNRLTDPVKEASFWIDHVLENKGAEHLKSSAEDLTWYQYLLVDVFALFLGILAIFTLSLIMLTKMAATGFRKLLHTFFSSSVNSKLKKEKSS